MHTCAQPCSAAGRDAFPDDRNVPLWFSAYAPQTSPTTTPPDPVHRNSRNPFLPYIHQRDTPPHTGADNPVAGAFAVSPFAPTSQRDVSFRNSHVGGSSSTLSNIDNSIKENCNNVTNYHFHFAPGGSPSPPPPPPPPGTLYPTYGENDGYGVYGSGTFGLDTGVPVGNDRESRNPVSADER
ncbi:hypothetical protein BDP27DRAFT_45186 [Rhodocollybia butyracea]|uniref:Uncharacterized protein n=1 Tax=Rhodocollybia butyracea TaxID=206335 RepID=A0A9P5PKN2_9AGAR|nr:hypothetical protein BDP27DRAFT_45186 [Rhodocollybia butyracea]